MKRESGRATQTASTERKIGSHMSEGEVFVELKLGEVLSVVRVYVVD